jgi:hypothetical protein
MIDYQLVPSTAAVKVHRWSLEKVKSMNQCSINRTKHCPAKQQPSRAARPVSTRAIGHSGGTAGSALCKSFGAHPLNQQNHAVAHVVMIEKVDRGWFAQYRWSFLSEFIII